MTDLGGFGFTGQVTDSFCEEKTWSLVLANSQSITPRHKREEEHSRQYLHCVFREQIATHPSLLLPQRLIPTYSLHASPTLPLNPPQRLSVWPTTSNCPTPHTAPLHCAQKHYAALYIARPRVTEFLKWFQDHYSFSRRLETDENKSLLCFHYIQIFGCTTCVLAK